VFGSCAEDGLLNVWDFEKASNSLFSLFFLVCYTNQQFLADLALRNISDIPCMV
jgi:hypothetical protein